MTWMRRLAATLATLAVANGAVITRLTGVNRSEIHQASAGGGTHVYLLGTSLGSAFSPPTVRIGITAGAGTECVVQAFTSSKNRLHCIISANGLPPPTADYRTTADHVSLPLRMEKGGRPADCWHVGGLNHGCFVQLDLSGTPRFHRVQTRLLQSRIRPNPPPPPPPTPHPPAGAGRDRRVKRTRWGGGRKKKKIFFLIFFFFPAG